MIESGLAGSVDEVESGRSGAAPDKVEPLFKWPLHGADATSPLKCKQHAHNRASIASGIFMAIVYHVRIEKTKCDYVMSVYLSTIVLMCFITLDHCGECRSVGDMKSGW